MRVSKNFSTCIYPRMWPEFWHSWKCVILYVSSNNNQGPFIGDLNRVVVLRESSTSSFLEKFSLDFKSLPLRDNFVE